MPFKTKTCAHLIAIKQPQQATTYACAECLKTNDEWVHLRTCQDCGTTLCCDSSPNQHASKHAAAHNHNVISSAEPGERWLYCYKDKLLTNY